MTATACTAPHDVEFVGLVSSKSATEPSDLNALKAAFGTGCLDQLRAYTRASDNTLYKAKARYGYHEIAIRTGRVGRRQPQRAVLRAAAEEDHPLAEEQRQRRDLTAYPMASGDEPGVLHVLAAKSRSAGRDYCRHLLLKHSASSTVRRSVAPVKRWAAIRQTDHRTCEGVLRWQPAG